MLRLILILSALFWLDAGCGERPVHELVRLLSSSSAPRQEVREPGDWYRELDRETDSVLRQMEETPA